MQIFPHDGRVLQRLDFFPSAYNQFYTGQTVISRVVREHRLIMQLSSLMPRPEQINNYWELEMIYETREQNCLLLITILENGLFISI